MNHEFIGENYPSQDDATPAALERRGAVATIGFFDGVHQGHQWLIRQVVGIARSRSLASLIVTFAEHPAHVLHPEARVPLLTSCSEKESLLLAQGVDRVEMLHFDRAMAALSAYEFMQTVLKNQLGVGVLVIGYDHRFGHNRAEGFDDYVRYGHSLGIEVVAAEELPHAPSPSAQLPAAESGSISSSFIRDLLAQGEVFAASHWLGRPYRLSGRVVEGHHVGRELGYPTANIRPDDALKVIPQRGVYAVRVLLADGSRHAGMLNIGRRPTVRNGRDVSIEVFVLDFADDLYGAPLTLEFHYFLRAERTFDTLAALTAQLHADEARVRQLLADCDVE